MCNCPDLSKINLYFQIQLSVLKDEKRKLLEKLKLSEKKKEKSLENIDLNILNNKKYHTLPLKSGMDSLEIQYQHYYSVYSNHSRYLIMI